MSIRDLFPDYDYSTEEIGDGHPCLWYETVGHVFMKDQHEIAIMRNQGKWTATITFSHKTEPHATVEQAAQAAIDLLALLTRLETNDKGP